MRARHAPATDRPSDRASDRGRVGVGGGLYAELLGNI